MNTGPLCAPSSENSYAKKLIVKKLLSGVLGVLAVSFAALTTVRDHPTGSGEGDEVNSVRFGLSRQRPAFRKAISMLAEAAPANQRLADYYERVKRRVKGDDGEAEENVGAGAVITVRKNGSGPPDSPDITGVSASLTPSQVALQSLMPVAEAAGTAERAPLPGDATEGDTESRDEGQTSAQAQLTVGDIAFDTNPAIEQWMNYYGATPIGRGTLKIGIERSNSYLEMARAEFRNAGVPEDLVWLAFVESVWNPRALSPAAAGGMWQFIAATATEYGLKVQSGTDERADPFKQTRVAAAYLRDLYTIFGDWTLAMAAYNAGEPGVMGAIIRNGNANFWEMYDKQLLPRETCNYIPKILAAIRIASQAEFYGLTPEAPVFAAG